MSAVEVRKPLGLVRVVLCGLLLAAATLLVTGLVAEAATDPTNSFGWDFRYQYYTGAQAVANGEALYLSPDDPALGDALVKIRAYVYPPTLAVALVPLAALSVDVANVLALIGSLAALLGALAVIGVRDARCYAVVLIWPPAIGAFTVVNLTPLLVLALALLWRFRRTLWLTALVLGLAVSAKLLLAPMFVWAFVVRRAAALLAAVVALAATALAFAAIGFQGMVDYPRLVQRLLDLHAVNSYSFVALAHELGLPTAVGRVVSLGVGAALLLWCVVLVRRGDEVRAFTSATAATLALSPIVWMHYLLALVVPLGIARPRLSPLWLLPLVLWTTRKSGYTDGLATLLPAAVILVLVALLLSPSRPTARIATPAGT